MKKFGLTDLIRLALIFLAVTLWLASMSWSETAAQAPPDRPEPPPDVPSAPPGRTQPPHVEGGGGGGSGGDHKGESYSFNPCSTVYGVVINWGYRNEPKLPVTLSRPGWQTQKVTDDNGYYASDCLGFGVALLNPVSPPWLRPQTTDVAIRLGFRQTFEVNLGVYGGEIAPTPEVMPTMTVSPKLAQPGETVTYTIRVTNTLRLPDGNRQAMGAVMVTDLLPEILTPIAATSTAGVMEGWGNLFTFDVGELLPDQTVTILLTAKVRDGAPSAAVITHRASLLYTGHVAVQTPAVNVVVR